MNEFKFSIPPGMKLGDIPQNGSAPYGAMSQVLAFRGVINGNGYLASTNGRILAVMPGCQPGPDVPVLLPPDACNGNGKGSELTVAADVRVTRGKKTELQALPRKRGDSRISLTCSRILPNCAKRMPFA